MAVFKQAGTCIGASSKHKARRLPSFSHLRTIILPHYMMDSCAQRIPNSRADRDDDQRPTGSCNRDIGHYSHSSRCCYSYWPYLDRTIIIDP